jgi:ribonuclease-3
LPPALAETVFQHASWVDDRAASYERLEFLGDSVLELAVAHALYERYPDFSEGRLAKVRSHVVSRASCAVVARELDLGARLGEYAPELAPDELERLAVNRNVLAALLHKTELQEVLARTGKQVMYVVLAAEGPPHDRHFTCAALVDGEQFGVGAGSSKKAAEQEAAREALAALVAG